MVNFEQYTISQIAQGNGITIRKMAERLGVSYSHLLRVNKGVSMMSAYDFLMIHQEFAIPYDKIYVGEWVK